MYKEKTDTMTMDKTKLETAVEALKNIERITEWSNGQTASDVKRIARDALALIAQSDASASQSGKEE